MFSAYARFLGAHLNQRRPNSRLRVAGRFMLGAQQRHKFLCGAFLMRERVIQTATYWTGFAWLQHSAHVQGFRRNH